MKSFFRPTMVPDKALLDEHRTLIRAIERRQIIRGGLSLGALVMLSGCDFTTPDAVEKALRSISSLNDSVQSLLFNPKKLARTYPKFNAYYDITKLKPVDGQSWKLELSGRISNKTPWTVADIEALPQQDEIIKHICVEGWSYIGEWSGVVLGHFLERIGADLSAKYVNFLTADDYPSSIDMATALHPQTLLATKYAGETMAAPFGYPLRLRTSTKLGYKNPKWITAMEVTNTYRPGFWEKAGFNWFGGI
jgi:DMSO/TMAO reductase YedYZ molybdopterin-dependent catalytic subunit